MPLQKQIRSHWRNIRWYLKGVQIQTPPLENTYLKYRCPTLTGRTRTALSNCQTFLAILVARARHPDDTAADRPTSSSCNHSGNSSCRPAARTNTGCTPREPMRRQGPSPSRAIRSRSPSNPIRSQSLSHPNPNRSTNHHPSRNRPNRSRLVPNLRSRSRGLPRNRTLLSMSQRSAMSHRKCQRYERRDLSSPGLRRCDLRCYPRNYGRNCRRRKSAIGHH